jgi:hypothetical protein
MSVFDAGVGDPIQLSKIPHRVSPEEVVRNSQQLETTPPSVAKYSSTLQKNMNPFTSRSIFTVGKLQNVALPPRNTVADYILVLTAASAQRIAPQCFIFITTVHQQNACQRTIIEVIGISRFEDHEEMSSD